MISKTLVTAFLAASFIAGSYSSPCKVSSKTTDVSTTAEVLSTATSTEIPGNTETVLSTTDVAEASSTSDDTITVTTETDLSPTNVESSTETFIISKDATTTALPTTDLTSTAEDTSTEISTIWTDTTTTAESTTEDTTTADSTTTTAEAPPAQTFILNAGFDDEPDTISPWSSFFFDSAFSLSSTTKYEGRNSAQLTYVDARVTPNGRVNYIRQPLRGTPQADAGYLVTAWVRPASGCLGAFIFCAFRVQTPTSSIPTIPVNTAADQWIKVSQTCTFTQAQIDAGELYVYVGLNCPKEATAYIDSVTFGQ